MVLSRFGAAEIKLKPQNVPYTSGQSQTHSLGTSYQTKTLARILPRLRQWPTVNWPTHTLSFEAESFVVFASYYIAGL